MATTNVIAGAGLAAVEAAGALRQTDPETRILLVGDEAHPFYSRIRLPEFVSGAVGADRLVVKKPEWYDERRIELRLGVRVDSVDAKARTLALADGSSLKYDQLLLATGARCFVPPVPGADQDGVVAVRTLDDAAVLRERCGDGTEVVAVGGGLLGLEMAVALASRGARVTVVEVFDWLLPRQLDPAGGGVLRDLLEAKGLAFRTGASVTAIAGEGSVRAVRLKGGDELPADLVVISAGVRPRAELAVTAGCAVDKGIVVDDRMATDVEGIFAAGDCSQHHGQLYGIWPAAEQQGKVAGIVMGGGEARYSGTVRSNRLKVTGIDVLTLGDHDPDGTRRSEVTRGSGTYRKLVRDDAGRLLGAVLVGDLTGHRALAHELSEVTP